MCGKNLEHPEGATSRCGRYGNQACASTADAGNVRAGRYWRSTPVAVIPAKTLPVIPAQAGIHVQSG